MLFVFLVVSNSFSEKNIEKQRIKAIAIPLADHYAGIIAYEKYGKDMKYADFQLRILNGPSLVRAYFRSEQDADIAFNVAPMVIDMYIENPNFKLISLIHRDGNALAINKLLNKKVNLAVNKNKRKPDNKVADAFLEFSKELDHSIVCAIPSTLATHATVFYKYLKDHGRTFTLKKNSKSDVYLKIISPPKSPAFLKKKSIRQIPAAFEQSLPWPEIADEGNYGHVAWYSKDVMKHKLGHVECVIIAKNSVISKKKSALKEVIYYIHKAGIDIENARKEGGKELDNIIKMIRKYIPKHTKKAIINSLDPKLNVINYKNLNIDDNSKDSLRKIMNLAVEAGFLKSKIDINALTDDSFATKITIDK